MLNIPLEIEVIRELFPAYLLIDIEGQVLSSGPYYERIGVFASGRRSFFEVFACETHQSMEALLKLPQSGAPIRFRCHDSNTLFQGLVVPVPLGLLLAVNLIPTAQAVAEGQFQIGDFGAADPLASGVLALVMQQAALEDARTAAQDLAVEQGRTNTLLRRVSRMAGYLAHDFNNFLSIIELNSDLLLKDFAIHDRLRPRLQVIQDTVRRASETTYSLMTLAKLRHDSRSRIAVDELIERNVSFLRTVAGHDIALALDLVAQGSHVEVAAGALLNCLTNLVINARDSISAKGLIIISTRLAVQQPLHGASPGQAQNVLISVIDNGSGMTEDIARQAFEPLFSTKATGNGMGLASVRDFCLEMGGDAMLRSEPGRGTTITLQLPLVGPSAESKDAGSEDDVRTPGSESPQSHDEGSGAKPVAMIVEDEWYAREALGELLADLGFDALFAANADEAITQLPERRVDLLLADVVMPGMSGIELANWVEERSLAETIVLMSGQLPATQAMRNNWLFIRKPLSAQRIRDILSGIEPLRKRLSLPASA